MRLLFFDTELTALSGMVRELAWLEASVTEVGVQLVSAKHYQTNKAYQKGRRMPAAVEFALAAKRANAYVGHNVAYDIGVLNKELRRLKRSALPSRLQVCTMSSKGVIAHCKLPMDGANRGTDARVGGLAPRDRVPPSGSQEYKYPSLDELYRTLFGREILGRSLLGKHTALVDVLATFECFVALQKMNVLDVSLSARGFRAPQT